MWMTFIEQLLKRAVITCQPTITIDKSLNKVIMIHCKPLKPAEAATAYDAGFLLPVSYEKARE